MANTVSTPTHIEYYLEAPIYKSFDFEVKDMRNWFILLFSVFNIDSYCVECKKESTFTSISNYPLFNGMPVKEYKMFIKFIGESYFNDFNTINKYFICARNSSHKLVFITLVKNSKIIKIGQYPSIADLSITSVEKYRKILGSKYSEFSRSIGLKAHGIGIGSFVYLRRIFEGLIEEAHQEALKKETVWDEGNYQKSRMDEKINILNGYLPVFLIENKTIYSILSKGVHELSEEECLSIFEVVKVGIELILDEKIQIVERNKKIEDAKKTLSSVNQKLKK